MNRLVQQAKLRSYQTLPKYKYGFRVPSSYADAIRLDIAAGNRKWRDASDLEMEQLREYEVFIDKGKFSYSKIPRGFNPLRVHMVFDVKHNHRKKCVCSLVLSLTFIKKGRNPAHPFENLLP